jgi:hypothetical protein
MIHGGVAWVGWNQELEFQTLVGCKWPWILQCTLLLSLQLLSDPCEITSLVWWNRLMISTLNPCCTLGRAVLLWSNGRASLQTCWWHCFLCSMLFFLVEVWSQVRDLILMGPRVSQGLKGIALPGVLVQPLFKRCVPNLKLTVMSCFFSCNSDCSSERGD